MDSSAGEEGVIELVSAKYAAQLSLLHASRQWGASGYSHAPAVLEYYRELDCKTILDYGCGRGTLKSTLSESIAPEYIREFDPGIAGKNALPEPADLLVANDVLEHIEPDRLEITLAYLRSLTLKGAYFTIALTLSKVSLPDGRNAHLICRPESWWLERLREAEFMIGRSEMRKGLWVWAR